MAYVFIDVLKVGDFVDGNNVNNSRNAHQIGVLEAFLLNNSGFLRGFTLNNELMLIRNKFRYYACYFAHCFIIFFFLI